MNRENIDKLIGSPWRLLNVADFLTIGLMSLLFMLMLQVLGMGWHRINLLRVTGSARSITRPVPYGTMNTVDPNTLIGSEQ